MHTHSFVDCEAQVIGINDSAYILCRWLVACIYLEKAWDEDRTLGQSTCLSSPSPPIPSNGTKKQRLQSGYDVCYCMIIRL